MVLHETKGHIITVPSYTPRSGENSYGQASAIFPTGFCWPSPSEELVVGPLGVAGVYATPMCYPISL